MCYCRPYVRTRCCKRPECVKPTVIEHTQPSISDRMTAGELRAAGYAIDAAVPNGASVLRSALSYAQEPGKIVGDRLIVKITVTLAPGQAWIHEKSDVR